MKRLIVKGWVEKDDIQDIKYRLRETPVFPTEIGVRRSLAGYTGIKPVKVKIVFEY